MVVEVDRKNVGICLDAVHAYLASRFYNFNYLAAIASVAPYVKHIHLHDNYGRASKFHEKKQLEMTAVGRGDMHMPIGWGEVPVTGTLSILKHYQGVITLVMQPRYRHYYKESLEGSCFWWAAKVLWPWPSWPPAGRSENNRSLNGRRKRGQPAQPGARDGFLPGAGKDTCFHHCRLC